MKKQYVLTSNKMLGPERPAEQSDGHVIDVNVYVSVKMAV